MRARRSGTTAATCCSRVEVSLLPLWEKVADEVRRMRGLYPRRQTPHPSRCSCASIADAKHRRPFLSTAADGRLCHLLPQGEKEKPRLRLRQRAALTSSANRCHISGRQLPLAEPDVDGNIHTLVSPISSDC